MARLPHPRHQRIRAMIALVCAMFAFSATVAGTIGALEASGLESGDIGLSFTSVLNTLRIDKLSAGGKSIGFLGDSTVVSYPEGEKLPDRLREVLAERHKRKVSVFNLAIPGMSSWDFYVLADKVVRSRPDMLIVAINLASFSPSWRTRFGRGDIVGSVSPSRLPDLHSRPYHVWGLTLDRVLLYLAVEQLGASGTWEIFVSEQVRASHGLDALRRGLSSANRKSGSGLPRTPSSRLKGNNARFNATMTREMYADALAGIESAHPVARMLDGALAVFHEAEIEILAYVVPMNLEHLENVGIEVGSGLEQSIDNLREIVRGYGGRFIDLHAIFDDSEFRDPPGHFAQTGDFDGPTLVARLLAPNALRALRDGDRSRSATKRRVN
jgi:hypothetical protein